MVEGRIPVQFNGLSDLLRNGSELYVQGVNISGPGKVYEVLERKPGRVIGLFLGDLIEASFQHRDCGCGPKLTAQGDYLVQTGRISFTPGFALGGPATKYDLARNITVGETNELFLYFKEMPKEKARQTIEISHASELK